MLDTLSELDIPPRFQCLTYRFSLTFLRQSLQHAIKPFEIQATSLSSKEIDAPKRASFDFNSMFNAIGKVLAQENEQLIRKLFIVNAYHTWERAVCKAFSIAAPTEKDPQGFKKIEKAALRLDFVLHPDLTHVAYLTNILKHGRTKQAHQLYKEWPTLFTFPNSQQINIEEIECLGWTASVRLDAMWIDKIFNILEQSGPPMFEEARRDCSGYEYPP